MTAEALPTAPSVGTTGAAAWAARVAADAVILDCGTITITPVANTPTSYALTFNKEFPGTPVVTVSAKTQIPEDVSVGVNGVDSTGCDVWMTRVDTTDTDVYWIAVQIP